MATLYSTLSCSPQTVAHPGEGPVGPPPVGPPPLLSKGLDDRTLPPSPLSQGLDPAKIHIQILPTDPHTFL